LASLLLKAYLTKLILEAIMEYNGTQSKQRQMPLDARSVCRALKPIFIRKWISALVFMGVILLIGVPARAHDYILETGHNWIKGQAHEARLGDILGNLAERCGYTIYLDEKLVSVPVTFDIPVKLEAEKAIRRIVHPFSYALVFARVPGKPGIRIEQVKVYSQGSQSAHYVLMSGNGSGFTAKSSYARGGAGGSGRALSSGVHAGMAAAQRNVRPPLEITKSSLGFTGYRFHNSKKGPDYRPDTMSLAKSYSEYRQERKAYQQRVDSTVLLSGKRNAEKGKSRFRAQRTESIQQTLAGAQQ
jgi:hypothetical protein